MTQNKIYKTYKKIEQFHTKYLKKQGVNLPKLKNNTGLYTKDALILIYLSQGYPHTKKATKEELTQFIRKYYPNTNDVQQGRHLGAQKGWWILAGGRDNIVLSLKRGEYQLYTLKKSYPGFKQSRRKLKSINWNDIKKYLNKIIHDDTLNFLPKLKSNSIDIVLTDPPYFLDKMDHNWSAKKVKGPKKPYAIKHLPAGMKFNREQGKNFYSWYLKISKELFRVLKPGGFFFSFSSPRLYHRMTCAIDDVGFEIRDCFIWLYTQNQPKAMSLHHFINKTNKTQKEKERLNSQFKEWKTPQVKSCHEPIAMAQKPIEGTYLENSIKHNVSLINTKIKQGQYKDMFVSNIMTSEYISSKIDKVFLVDKPKENEKSSFNNHKTVKPLSLFKYLINLTTKPNSIVLDPFMGSGTTAVACKELNRNFIGVEINKQYIDIAIKRLSNLKGVKRQPKEFISEQRDLFL